MFGHGCEPFCGVPAPGAVVPGAFGAVELGLDDPALVDGLEVLGVLVVGAVVVVVAAAHVAAAPPPRRAPARAEAASAVRGRIMCSPPFREDGPTLWHQPRKGLGTPAECSTRPRPGRARSGRDFPAGSSTSTAKPPVVRPLGFEPRTCGLRVRCSAVELEARGAPAIVLDPEGRSHPASRSGEAGRGRARPPGSGLRRGRPHGMGWPRGLEPPTSRATTWRSNRAELRPPWGGTSIRHRPPPPPHVLRDRGVPGDHLDHAERKKGRRGCDDYPRPGSALVAQLDRAPDF